MSKQRIGWIVVLMAVGLLGLIGLQLYWIKSALRLQKEQFDYKVTDALQEVVRTLERHETVVLLKQRVQAREQQNRLMAIAKKVDKPVVQKVKPVGQNQNRVAKRPDRPRKPSPDELTYGRLGNTPPAGAMVVQSDVLHPTTHPLSAEQMQVVEAFFREQEELMAIGDWQAQMIQQQQFDRWVEQVIANERNQINSQVAQNANRRDSLARVKRQRARRGVARPAGQTPKPVASGSALSRPASVNQHRAEEQSTLIKEVLKNLLLADRPIEERIDRRSLDTLLRQALQERGIGIPFSYGVRTKSQPGFLFTSSGMANFDGNGYKAALFPNNLVESGNYVYVSFPTQQQFILNRLSFTLGASAVLILVILACFYIAISTIVRQKKLADIKNDFINNMTHEFKTPISTISLAVEMAQDQLQSSGGLPNTLTNPTTPEPARLTRYMGIIRDETRRLGSHVEKVLQMALLDRGEIKLKLQPVNVHDVIEKVLNNIGLQIEQRAGEVDLVFEADQEIVEADEIHLTNILYNLVDNAIKYSPESPHITIQTRSLSDGISITVADQGLGMTKEQISRIFEKFYRVPTGNRHDVKGFGLGLSYVKKMVDEHHGQIRVDSQPGRGSSFEIVIPYKTSEG